MNTIDVSLKTRSIEELTVTQGMIQFLQRNGVTNLYELLQKTQDDFMRMRIVYGRGSERFLKRKELQAILVAIDELKKIFFIKTN